MNKANSIPLIYHPVNVLALDDDQVFLNTLRTTISTDFPYIVESNPDVAMRYLRERTYHETTLPSLIAQPDFDNIDGLVDSVEHFRIDFSRLREKLNEPDRFNKIAIVFVDKQMPKMDGLDFCRKVRGQNLQVKLILLTGNAGVHEAIDAFNEGIIDAYISKGEKGHAKIINDYIMRQTWQQFVDLGAHLFGLISHALLPLSDEKFIDFFHAIWQKHHKSEFYLMDSSCSFLFLNENGDGNLLLVRNNQDFDEALEFAKDSAVSDRVLSAIRDRKAFPVTPQKNGYLKLQGNQWDSAMCSVEPIDGTELYYALVEYPDMKAFSFSRYFTEIWPKKDGALSQKF